MNSNEIAITDLNQDTMIEKYPKPNRTIKDDVFKALFSIEKYLRALIVALLGEDRANGKIVDTTLSHILAGGGVYNDLSFCLKEAGRKDCVILAEAQSTWNIGIAYRLGSYYFHTMQRYFINNGQDIYHLSEKDIPESYLFVIYTGKDPQLPVVSFRRNLMNDPKYPVDVIVKVITLENATGILKEYILFSQMIDDKKGTSALTIEDVREVVEECIKKGILKDFLIQHRGEIVEMLENMFNQEIVSRNENLRHYREGEASGIKKGEQKSTERYVKGMLLEGVSDDRIMRISGISKQELNDFKAQLEADNREKL